MNVLTAGLSVFLMLSLLRAQNPVAYPQDSPKPAGRATFLPLGFHKVAPSLEECRYQQLIPASHLPSTGATIVGISVSTFAKTNPGALIYKSLKITLSKTSRTSLDRVFAVNQPQPLVVLDATNLKVVYRWDQWVTIPFTTHFPYDGSSNLVVQFQKTIDSKNQAFEWAHQLNPARTLVQKMPQTRSTSGTQGSGAATAVLAASTSDPIKLRLMIRGPTLTVESDPVGASKSKVFTIGSRFSVTMHGPSGHRFVNMFSIGFGQPVALFRGRVYLNSPAHLLSAGTIGSSGTARSYFLIPQNPSLVGSLIVVQGATATATGGGTSVTCATSFPIDR